MIEIRKRLSMNDFAYTRWYQLPKDHVLHVIWCDNDYIMITLTGQDFHNIERLIDQQKLQYGSDKLNDYIKSLNKMIKDYLRG